MRLKLLLIVTSFFLSSLTFSQELKCEIEVNYNQLSSSDPVLIEALKQSIYSFMNNRRWTTKVYGPNEKIECSILLTLTNQVGSDQFKGTMQITSRRPIYNSSYNSSLFLFKDNDVEFTYQQFDVLEFAQNTFLSNLTSMLAFYAYMIIGFDNDSFSLNGGEAEFKQAVAVVNTAQSAGEAGWKSFDGRNNRYWLVQNHIAPRFEEIRKCIYIYYRQGFDAMNENVDDGRKKIFEALELLRPVYKNAPNSLNLRLFFNSKSDEIINLYQGAPRDEKTKIVSLLNDIDPANTNKYQKIFDNGK